MRTIVRRALFAMPLVGVAAMLPAPGMASTARMQSAIDAVIASNRALSAQVARLSEKMAALNAELVRLEAELERAVAAERDPSDPDPPGSA